MRAWQFSYWVALIGLVGWVGAIAAPAMADVTLTDANAVVKFDLQSDKGMYSWTIDGLEHLNKQWCWYRLGDAGEENSIDTLTLDAQGTSDTNFDGNNETLFVRYAGANFKIELTFTLTGGTAGSRTADLAESLKIVNTSTTESLDFHFFQYSDFDLANTTLDASVEITGGNTAVQKDSGVTRLETVEVPRASHYEVAVYPSILNELNDGDPTTLDDTAGPLYNANLAWAFEWDFQLGPEHTFLISKDKHIVPEPSTLLVLVLGGIGVLLRRRSRHG